MRQQQNIYIFNVSQTDSTKFRRFNFVFESYDEVQEFLIDQTKELLKNVSLRAFDHGFEHLLIASFDPITGQQLDLFKMIHSPKFNKLQELLIALKKARHQWNQRHL